MHANRSSLQLRTLISGCVLLAQILFVSASHAQTQSSNTQNAAQESQYPDYLGDAGTETTDVVSPKDPPSIDDNLNYTPDQMAQAAEVYATESDAVVRRMFDLATKLDDQKKPTYIKLGERRIADFQAALALPETDERAAKYKKSLLRFLRYDDYKDLDLTSDDTKTKIGKKIFKKRLEDLDHTEDFELKIEGEGVARPLQVKDWVITRVIEEKSGVMFFVLPDGFPTEARAFRRLVAQMRVQGADGKGAPVVVVETKLNEAEGDASHPVHYKAYEPPKTLGQKIRTWWTSVYATPTKDDLVMSGISTGFAFGTNEGIRSLNYFIGATHAASQTNILATAASTLLLGIWGETYKNIVGDSVHTLPSVLKRSIANAMVYYTIQIMNHGGSLHTLSLTHLGGWMEHLAIWGTAIASTADQWKQFVEIRKGNLLSDGKIEVLGAKIKQNKLEKLVIKLIPKTIKKVIFSEVANPLADTKLTFGAMVYYSSYVWSQYLVMKWAEINQYMGADQLRAKWEKLISTPKQAMVAVGDAVDSMVDMTTFAVINPNAFVKYAGQEVLNAFEKLPGMSHCEWIMSGGARRDESKETPFTPTNNGWMEMNP